MQLRIDWTGQEYKKRKHQNKDSPNDLKESSAASCVYSKARPLKSPEPNNQTSRWIYLTLGKSNCGTMAFDRMILHLRPIIRAPTPVSCLTLLLQFVEGEPRNPLMLKTVLEEGGAGGQRKKDKQKHWKSPPIVCGLAHWLLGNLRLYLFVEAKQKLANPWTIIGKMYANSG